MVAPFAHQWHAEPFEFGARVCRGSHAPTQPCQWEYFTPAEPSPPLLWIADGRGGVTGPRGERILCYADPAPAPLHALSPSLAQRVADLMNRGRDR